MKSGDLVAVSSPFDRLFPPHGEAVVRWVFPGGNLWLEDTGAFERGVTFDRDNGANFSPSLVTATGASLTNVANWAKGAEIDFNLSSIKANGSLATVTLVASSVAENATAIRTAYSAATALEAIMIADYLSTLTDTQLMNAFNLTAQQVTNLRSNKLTPAANTASAIRSAVGA
jgi:hypothetical protein